MANDPQYIIEVSCGVGESCASFKKRIDYLEFQRTDQLDTTKYLGYLFSEGGIHSPVVEIAEDPVKKIQISFKVKPRIRKINITYIGPSHGIDLNVSLMQTGDIFSIAKERESIRVLKKALIELGYENPEIALNKVLIDEFVELNYVINPKQPVLFSEIVLETSNEWIRSQFMNFIQPNLGKAYARSRVFARIDEYVLQLKNMGFLLINHELKEENIDTHKKRLNFKLQTGRMYSIGLSGSAISKELKKSVFEKLFKFNSEPGVEDVKDAVTEYWTQFGYKNTIVTVQRYEYVDEYKLPHLHFQIDFNKGIRTKIRSISFKGGNFFNKSELENFFYQDGTDLISAKNYDHAYIQQFPELLTKHLHEVGFVSASVFPAKVFFSSDDQSADIHYSIKEGPRTFVEDIKLIGVPDDVFTIKKSLLRNEIGDFFNPAHLKVDLDKVQDELQRLGYYSVKVDRRAEKLVKYSTDLTSVQINYHVDLGVRYKLDKIIVLGAEKTRLKLINRNLRFATGQYLDARKLNLSRSGLSNTGLFNKVRIEPVFFGNSSTADVVVFLEEKKYGTVEIAPGFRTDIGAKISSSVTYSNLFGLNHSVTLRGQINQRLNFTTLDQRRREEKIEFLEYEGRAIYNAPSVFDSQYDYSASMSFQKRRFYSFDADIQRVANNIKRPVGQKWIFSLRHQIESIEQYDASNQIDNGRFVIGSLTPGLSYDARNSQINPTQGYWGSLSAEYATPDFMSESAINYIKWIGRNRFYIPIPNGVIASSITLGLQKNLGPDNSFIPNIKVFRLAGADIVRGFDDQEINRTKTGKDISDVLVQDAAFMTNIKIEPRFFINDTMMWGVFYDAGRIYVNSWTTGDLRSAVGLTFKYVTPVGTLDFDYGVKVLRKEMSDGNLESPGRLHISIGFF